jgi:hypothetical protein
MILDVLICTIYIFLFTYIVWKGTFFSGEGIPKYYFLAAFFLKILIGILGWQFYSSIYPHNDASGFYESSKVIYDLYFQNSDQFFKLFLGHEDVALKPYLDQLIGWNDSYLTLFVNDSRTIIRYNVILQFISFGVFHVHTIVSCFLSLLGLTFIYKSIQLFIKGKSKLVFVVIFLLPSVLFWSSLVFKESLVFLGLGIVLYHSHVGLRKSYSVDSIFYLLLGFLLMLFIKPYLIFCILPALIANAIFIRLKKIKIVLVYLCTFIFLFALVMIIHKQFPQYDLVQKVKEKQELFNKSARGGVYLKTADFFIFVDYHQRNEKLIFLSDSTCKLNPRFTFKKFVLNKPDTSLVEKMEYSYIYEIPYDSPPAGSYNQTTVLDGSIGQLILLSPQKFFDVLILKDFFKHKGLLICLSILENSLLILALIVALFFSEIKKEHLPIVLFSLCFISCLYLITGFTTPVLGAIVRYKVPAMPFLGLIVVLLYQPQKLKAFLKRFSGQKS